MAVDNLARVVPPPRQPLEAIAAARWQKAEAALKIRLPADYRAYTEKYGNGVFRQTASNGQPAGHVWIYVPTATDYLRSVKHDLKNYRALRAEDPDLYEYPAHARSPGVFPVGRDDAGMAIYYLTEGDPDRWPIVVRSRDGVDFERYDRPLTALLAGLFAGEPTPPWPTGWFEPGSVVFDPKSSEGLPPTRRYATLYAHYAANGNRANFWVSADYMEPEGYAYHVKRVGGESGGPAEAGAPVIADIVQAGVLESADQDITQHAIDPTYFLVRPPRAERAEQNGDK